jgi:hypothetical protein
VIVASVAPRRLIYGQEFAWDRERDPVWPRLQKVFGWYGVSDRLAVAFGRGTLKGSPPASSHCNNIGPLHRNKIYPALKRWFGMPVPREYSWRRSADELRCLTPAAVKEFRPRPVHALAADLAEKQIKAARRRLAGLAPPARRKQLRRVWTRLLGRVTPPADPKLLRRQKQQVGKVAVERLVLEVESGMVVPVVLLAPAHQKGTRLPVVVGLAQGGKQGFLRHRPEALAEALRGGAAVCLPDLRGIGETRPAGTSRRHGGADTSLSAAEWMLGETLLGARLRDLRCVLRYLRGRPDLDPRRVALWGDSFAPPNPRGRNLAVPLDAARFPDQAEPLGGLLALLGGLFEEDVRAVVVSGGLLGYRSLLDSPFLYVPHDALVPGVFSAGDVCDLAAALAPRGLWVEGLVDGLNLEVTVARTAREFAPVRTVYRSLKAASQLHLEKKGETRRPAIRWLLRQFRMD